MTMLVVELIEKLRGLDEISLLELLKIDSEQLVDRFEDVIENKYEELLKEVD